MLSLMLNCRSDFGRSDFGKEELGATGLRLFDDFLNGLIESFNVNGFADEAIHSNNQAGGSFGLLIVCGHRNDGSVFGRING